MRLLLQISIFSLQSPWKNRRSAILRQSWCTLSTCLWRAQRTNHRRLSCEMRRRMLFNRTSKSQEWPSRWSFRRISCHTHHRRPMPIGNRTHWYRSCESQESSSRRNYRRPLCGMWHRRPLLMGNRTHWYHSCQFQKSTSGFHRCRLNAKMVRRWRIASDFFRI